MILKLLFTGLAGVGGNHLDNEYAGGRIKKGIASLWNSASSAAAKLSDSPDQSADTPKSPPKPAENGSIDFVEAIQRASNGDIAGAAAAATGSKKEESSGSGILNWLMGGRSSNDGDGMLSSIWEMARGNPIKSGIGVLLALFLGSKMLGGSDSAPAGWGSKLQTLAVVSAAVGGGVLLYKNYDKISNTLTADTGSNKNTEPGIAPTL